MFLIQLVSNFVLFVFSLLGFILYNKNILITIMAIELLLLSLNLFFITFSIYLDDIIGQIFSLFILTVAAAESALGLAIIISYFRLHNHIEIRSLPLLKN